MSIFIPNTAIPAKKYFCFNLLNNKITISLWSIPDTPAELYKSRFPRLSTFNCSSYSKFGIRWKRLLFEIIWNKRDYSFDTSS